MEAVKEGTDTSKWIALDENNKVLAKNANPNLVIKLADKSGKKYTLQYVPDPKRSYIF